MSDQGEYKAPQIITQRIMLPIWFVFSDKLNLLIEAYGNSPHTIVQMNMPTSHTTEAINAKYVSPTLVR